MSNGVLKLVFKPDNDEEGLQVQGDIGRCREIQGDVGRCREM